MRCNAIQWQDNAQKFVEFTSIEDEFGRVNTTMWVLPWAFKCAQTLDYLKENVSIVVGEVKNLNNVSIIVSAVKNLRNVSVVVSDADKYDAEGENIIDEKDHIISSLQNKNETQTEIPSNSSSQEVPNAKQVPNIILYRWRQYDIEVTAEDLNTGEKAVTVFEHNTFQWDCKDKLGTKITQTQFCDGTPNCPNERDEKSEICKVSQLPKKLSYLFYVYMILFILAYFPYLRVEPQHSEGQHLEMITKKAFNKYLYQREKSDFIAQYREIHLSESKCEKFFGDLKYEMYQNPAKMEEVCTWVKEAEEELHKDANAIYDCVLTNFGGSHQVTARIVDPKGDIVTKIGSKIDQMVRPRKIKWYLFKIAIMFAMLCLHMFDYVKDIGKVTEEELLL